ncbi:filamentous haemagglutinin family protein [Bradyrhizobium cenepequi]
MTAPGAFARPLGGQAPTPSAAAIAAAQSAQQETARAASQSSDALKRATLAIQAQQASQQAARDAARAAANASSVPNGLGVGGLQRAAGAVPGSNLWQGANLPTQFTDVDRVKVNVEQTQQKAILTWDTFNVGARTDLRFDQQGNRDWVALNRVLGTDGRPSQILGSIKADGSVYVINQNGIIFGGGSQVNAGALIASTAKISNEQFLSGIYSSGSGSNWTPSFTDAAEFLNNGRGGGVVKVEAGAQIETRAPSSVTSGGGFVLLMGGQVENVGSIATPLGQTQLAAGDDFVLRRGYGTDQNIASTTRGNEIAPLLRVGSLAGLIRNDGMVISAQGDITLAGRTIEQNGALVASTSVNTRGTIHLLNSATDTRGSVTLGAGSVTTIIPELESDETALNSQRDALITAAAEANFQRAGAAAGPFDNLSLLADRLDQSRIEIVSGGNVIFKGDASQQAGSLTIAQGGQVAVSAGGRIFNENGSTIDVSGVRNVSLAMSANNLMVNIQGNELRDSPQNRDNNALKNADVWIDIRDLTYVPSGTGGYDGDRYYTPGGLLEVGGYLANTPHKIGEWSAVGGTITLSAPEVIAQAGSVFDISGGSIRYEAGYIRTTNFLGPDGRLYNINDARADMTFYGLGHGFIRKHERWNVTEVWTSPFGRGRESVRWEQAYTVGRDAGKLILSTPTSVFEGDIIADVVEGERQSTTRPDNAADGYKLAQNVVAQAGTLALGQYTALGLTDAYTTDVKFTNMAAITAGLAAADALPAGRANTAWFDASHLNAQGLGGVDFATSGKITIDAPLSVVDGGSVSLVAGTVDINADITARSGHITATNHLMGFPRPSSLGTGKITLAAGVMLDARGLWANALADPASHRKRAFIDGGDVRLVSLGDVIVTEGSVIDVSSGGGIFAGGAVAGGRGGNVRLKASATIDGTSSTTGSLTLDGTVRGYGVNGGGTLAIASGGTIVLGGDITNGVLVAGDLLQSGFSHYDIDGQSGLVVAPGVRLDVTMPVYRLAPGAFTAPTGADPEVALELWTPPQYLDNPAKAELTQRAGADLSLVSSAGGITLALGSFIEVDDGRSVTLNALGQTTIEGAITARSGTITIVGNMPRPGVVPNFVPGQSIWIGEHAVLDVSARPVTSADARGRRYGIIRDGGAINIGMDSFTPAEKGDLPATRSLVIIRPGALLDASGTSGVVDLVSGVGLNAAQQPVTVASNGGSITIGSLAGLYLDGDMRAAAGGAGAAGGRLAIALETPMGLIPTIVDRPRTFTITQEREASTLAPGLVSGSMDPSVRYGEGYISASQVAEGGFDNLSLWSRDIFQFKGDVNLAMGQSLALYRGVLSPGVGASTANISLSAPYVLLDGAVQLEIPDGVIYPGLFMSTYAASSTNEGRLAVTADLIDLRNRVLSGVFATYDVSTSQRFAFDVPGFAEIKLVSRSDVRLGTGALVSAGNITIEAAQVYPTTGAKAQIAAGIIATNAPFRPNGTLTIRGNGTVSALPYSAFGSLSLLAATIDQGGVVRAPLGSIVISAYSSTNFINPSLSSNAATTLLRAGSITSTSAAGLVMPYGGTVDGLSYRYAGAEVVFDPLSSVFVPGKDLVGLSVTGGRFVAEAGAVIDLRGGGELTGAAFISGRGGSVDVLTTPLVNANPAFGYSGASNRIYALMPGYASSYAPNSPEKGAGDPLVGQQITLTQPAGGLPAGTYTLLPSTYALLPGAYRIELGGTSTAATGPTALANGSYVTMGTLGIANTSIRSVLPSRVILTPGQAVRSYAHYNEMGYSGFAVANAATFGGLRPRLPVDAQGLGLDFRLNTGETLSFHGTMLMEAGEGGYAGTLMVNSSNGAIEIKPAGTTATPGMASLDAEDLSRFGAGSLLIGGSYYYESGQGDVNATSAHIRLSSTSADVLVRSGSLLRAGQILIMAGNSIHIEHGAILDTTQSNTIVLDSMAGFVFLSPRASVAVSNGFLNFLPPIAAPSGAVTIDDGAVFRTLGTVAFSASTALDLGSNVALNARYLALNLPEINVGTDASLAAARDAGALGSGWLLTQSVLDRLLTPADPALAHAERLTLAVGSSLNFFGDVALDMRGANSGNAMLLLSTPAIYGWGTSGDVATMSADTVIWNGVSSGQGTTASPYVSLAPGAVRPGGPGTGAGSLAINAREIVLGYDPFSRPQNEATLDRLALGFSTVNLAASGRIIANNRGALAVYRSGTNASTYAGGDLNITAPLLTAEAGGFLSVTAGGAIVVRAGAGGPADTASVSELGGELRLKAGAITIDTAIALPSGRLELQAAGDITLTDRAALDLSARSATFFDVTKHSWGGDVVMASAGGVITQQAGSIIDVSAAHNDAGSIRAEALGTGGTVAFHGTLRGRGAEDFDSGSFDVRAFTLADFAGLNNKLSDSDFFGARSFLIKTGDLVIGNEVRARDVSISIDGGNLTVNGRIDASGATPGSIRLAARDDLTLASTAILDARSTVLQTDSYGAPIEASNRSDVELTSAQGTVRLAAGATIDLRSADNISRGRIEINAQRRGGVDGTGVGANDIAIEAAGPLNIRGAASVAVNGFRRYEPAGGIVNQSLLDAIHGDSSAFVNAALANAGLQNRLAGLRTYGDAFHLRPGVELWSSGDLSTEGDLDLSGHRYGPNANPAVRGSGEPGRLVIRAAGNLDINGSISDGFAPPPATPDDNGWVLLPGVQPVDIELSIGGTLAGGPSGTATTFAAGPNSPVVLDYAIPIRSSGLRKGATIPFEFTSTGTLSVPSWARSEGGWTATAPIWASAAARDGGQPPIFTAGQKVNVQLPSGTVFGAGTVLPPDSLASTAQYGQLGIAATTLPAGTPLNLFTGSVTLSANVVLAAGARIPAQTNVVLTVTPIGAISAPLTLPSGLILIGAATGTATTFPGGANSTAVLNFDISIRNATLRRGVTIPFQFTSAAALAVPSWAGAGGGWVTTAPIWVSMNAYIQGQPPLFATGDRVNVSLPTGTVFGAGTVLPSISGTTVAGTLNMVGSVVEAGTPLNVFNSAVTLSASVAVNAGTVLPTGSNIQQVISAPLRPAGSHGTQGKMWAVAPMLEPGSQSWSMRMAAGADLGSADSRALELEARNGEGNMRLYDPHYTMPFSINAATQAISVVRTGTGDLELLAAGEYRQDSPFGVYTAGTAMGGLARARRPDGTYLGSGNAAYEAAVNPTGIYFTGQGGDVLLRAGGDVSGFIAWRAASGQTHATSDVSGWSWTQDGNWGLNFGTYDATSPLFMRGFAGIGALGGGNVVISAGGDAGNGGGELVGMSTALVATVGSSGYVGAGGELVRSGGGTLTLDIAGWLNPGLAVDGVHGNLANLRGDIDLRAASVGRVIETGFGVAINGDPRLLDPLVPNGFLEAGRQNFSLGDGTLTLHSRSDIVATVSPAGNLWTDTTAAEFFSAGGDVSPLGSVPSLSTIAAHGSIYTGVSSSSSLKLLPSPIGQLELLAWNSINGYIRTGGISYLGLSAGSPISNLHIDDPEPVRVYAATGDISNLMVGWSSRAPNTGIWTYDPIGKYVWMRAGRDIVKSGFTVLNNRETDVSIVSAGRDIIFAEPVNYNYRIAGPGTLEVTAGRNIYQADPTNGFGPFISMGPLVVGDLRPGADIVVQAGVGSTGPDYAALAARYLNPANLAQPGVPLADQPGKVAKTYEAELSAWLEQRFGFNGTAEEAITYFDALPGEQRNIFLRQVYFAELRAGGREYNDPTSTRFNSYFRGREAISTLFPETDSNGDAIEREGDITIFGGSHIRTDFGGNIQMLAPNGRIVIGVEGAVPPSTAGIITQGAGDIQMYSKGSVLLGLSRIMTTFGGDILIWSAEGDINAGRGAKSTIVYTPAKRVYDNYGGVTLSPNVPSSGAGIATLNSIPGIPAGNIDLIAPIGTIDAGEAGIRSSGNVNLAALQILNAANIQAQGNTTGVPTVQAPPVAALAAGNNMTAATQQAQPAAPNTNDRPSIIIVEFLGFGGGDGSAPETSPSDIYTIKKRQSYNSDSSLQVVGLGEMSSEQQKRLIEGAGEGEGRKPDVPVR